MKIFLFGLSFAISLTTYSQQTTLFIEDFFDVTLGNHVSTRGSTSLWPENENFNSSSNCYPADGALKLGNASEVGSLTTKALDLSTNNGNFTVQLRIKGWSSIEGDIEISIGGSTTTVLRYDSLITNQFQRIEASFSGGQNGDSITIKTSHKRAFIDEIHVFTNTAPTGFIQKENKDRICIRKGEINVVLEKEQSIQVIYPNGYSFVVSGKYGSNIIKLQKGLYMINTGSIVKKILIN